MEQGSCVASVYGEKAGRKFFNEVGAIKGNTYGKWIPLDSKSGCREKGNTADQPEYGQKYYI